MRDLSTKAGVLAFAEKRRAEMVRTWERLRRFEINGFSYGAVLFITHTPPSPREMQQVALQLGQGAIVHMKPGPKLDRVEAMPVNLPNWLHGMPGSDTMEGHTRQRELFSRAVMGFGKMTKAIGCMFMCEMWALELPKVEGKTVQEQRDEFPADMSEAHGRVEELLMTLEHSALAGHRPMWRARISRNPDRLAPWSLSEPEDAQGRMVGLVDWKS